MTYLNKGAQYAKTLTEKLRAKTPVNAHSIASELQLNIRELEVDGFDGALVRAKGTPFAEVIVRSSIREQGRKNFTVAHELGHFVLPGHETDDVVCTAEEINNWSEQAREREREANEFAAELLMPTELVNQIIGPLQPSLETIAKVGEVCNTSLSSSGWRFCDLTGFRCAVIWSKEGKITWDRRSPEFRFGISRNALRQPGTFAYQCLQGKPGSNGPQPVDAELWIESSNLKKQSKIWEQSKSLPSYKAIFTLLWIRDRIEIFSDQDEDELLPELKPRRW